MRRARPKLAGNDWIAPRCNGYYRTVGFAMFLRGQPPGQPRSGARLPRATMSKPPRHGVTSVIPRIQTADHPVIERRERAQRDDAVRGHPRGLSRQSDRGSCARINFREMRDPSFLLFFFLPFLFVLSSPLSPRARGAGGRGKGGEKEFCRYALRRAVIIIHKYRLRLRSREAVDSRDTRSWKIITPPRRG